MFLTTGHSSTVSGPGGVELLAAGVLDGAPGAGERHLVLIGGCSQSGKSWLAERLAERIRAAGPTCLVVGLDAWVVSLENRKLGSTVLERYECPAIVAAVRRLLSGWPVHPPVYDPASRRRVRERADEALVIDSGILVGEGVIALTLPELRRWSRVRVFVAVPDEVRHARLRRLYCEVKGLDERATDEIIEAREAEEVAMIARTRAFADVVYWGVPE